VGRLLLDRLVAEGVRYGRDFALVRIALPLGTVEETAPTLARVLRDADVLVRWEADELLALLPATDRPGAERAAERLKEAVDGTPIAVGSAHWVGDTAHDLLSRAQPR
jgi:Diguanylate cyclase, GGDEF domain